MKRITLLLAIMLAVLFAHAQDDYYNDEIQTIFSKRKSNGGYGAFTLGYTQIDGKDAFLSGARGAFIFDHVLAIGAGGYGFVNNLNYYDYHHSPGNNDERFMLAGGYGGLLIEPIIAGRSPVHVSFPILIGMGGVALVENDYWGWEWDNNYYPGYTYDSDVFFVFEPGIELELNLARFFRLAAVASYRYTSELDLYQTTPDAIRGFNVGLTFKFGKF